MHMQAPKRKSRKRWQQYNYLVDTVIPKVPARHGVALLVCFRHADVNRRFQLAERYLAQAIGVDRRTVRRLMSDLAAWDAIKVVEEKRGTIPRRYAITGNVNCADTRAPTSTNPATRSSEDKNDQ